MALSVGLEVDYHLSSSVWVPARVEFVSGDGSLAVRFAVGWGVEVSHSLDPFLASRLVAPAGTFTLPLLDGQPVDFFQRLPGSGSFPASEQWLSGACSSSSLLRTPVITPPILVDVRA